MSSFDYKETFEHQSPLLLGDFATFSDWNPANMTYLDNFTLINYTNTNENGDQTSIILGGQSDSSDEEIPLEMRTMSESSIICVIVYSILFVFALTGNLKVSMSFYR